MQISVGNPIIGDLVKEFELPSTTGQPFKIGELAGKIAVLSFYPNEQIPECAETIDSLRDAYPEFESRGVRVAGISINSPDKQKTFAEQRHIPFPLLADTQLRASTLHGALRPKENGAAASDKLELNSIRRTLLVGPDCRIVKIYDNPEPAEHAKQILRDIDSLIRREPPRRMIAHAPVLLIPNVLPREFCQRLMQIWDEQGNEDSGFMRQVDGRTVGMYDYSHKIRRDHFMKPSPELETLKKFIGSRVIPSIKTAYNYDVTRFEDFRIACYDSSRGGYFRPHRDNTTEGTAHRRFAMSLLLNDDYQGGMLRFPEFAPHEYRPDAGSAVIFSCSLLHEATDVTAGKRFVLLSFFYGDKEAKIREEYNLRSGGNYRS